MRVIAGRAKSHKLHCIDASYARPTLDRVKESMFSTIQFNLKGARCLDAFACTGALGIEALSRGASHVDFCEINKDAFIVLKKNILKTNLSSFARLHNIDVFSYLVNSYDKYDFVFLDPPYNLSLVVKSLECLAYNDSLSDDSMVVIEHEKSLQLEYIYKFNGFGEYKLTKRKDFSETAVSYLSFVKFEE